MGKRIPSESQKQFVVDHIETIRKKARKLASSCNKSGSNIWYSAGLPMDLNDLEQEVILEILTGTPYDPVKSAAPYGYISSIAESTLRMLVRKLGNKRKRDAIQSIHNSVEFDDSLYNASYNMDIEEYDDGTGLLISEENADEYLYSSLSEEEYNSDDNFTGCFDPRK